MHPVGRLPNLIIYVHDNFSLSIPEFLVKRMTKKFSRTTTKKLLVNYSDLTHVPPGKLFGSPIDVTRTNKLLTTKSIIGQ